MALTEQWRAEKESAWLYRVVADSERDRPKSELFRELAETAEKQARLVAEEIVASGGSAPVSAFTPSLRIRVVGLLVRLLGPKRVRPALAAAKIRGLSVYASPPGEAEHPLPRSVEDFGDRHRQGVGGMNLRAAVFGINDGLVSNASLIMGVAGAASESSTILISGFAGLLAGAFSMAAGEYVSVRSQRELYEYQIGLEEEELELYPQEEAEELALIYQSRGVPLERAREMASLIFKDPRRALRTMAIEELGVNPDELGSPWAAAGSSFVAFFLGAALPLLPFFAVAGRAAVLVSAALSAVALFAVGAAISLLTGRNAAAGGLRMLTIGGAAAAATFLLGTLFGVALE